MVTKYLILGILIYFLIAGVSVVSADEDVDYKANFIIKLLDYVEWPTGAGADGSGNVVVHVVGSSPLTPVLQNLAKEKTAAGMGVTIKEVTLDDNLADCQILFMATKETADLAKILKRINGTTVLSISDAEYFGNYGVMINFFAEDDGGKSKTKFEINKTVVDMAGLKISSKLLKLAKII